MRALLFIALLAASAFASVDSDDFSSAQYQAQSADKKMRQLWDAIIEDVRPYGYYSALSKAGLFFESMKVTFDTDSDDMPYGRKKLIHSVGSVVQAEFVSTNDHPFTGMFEGVKNALIRVSTAKEVNPKAEAKDNFLPGMGIKLLRDRMPSANLVAMYGIEGQDSFNFFKYSWSHHIAAPCSYALKLAAKKFAEASPHTGRIGLKTWAEYDEDGNHYGDAKIKMPFRIHFKPTAEMQKRFPDKYQKDWKDQLSEIEKGTILWDVYAVAKPHADAVKIGYFKTKSKFTTSKFGDKDLFFQHNYVEDDLDLHPEWEAAVTADPPVPSKNT